MTVKELIKKHSLVINRDLSGLDRFSKKAVMLHTMSDKEKIAFISSVVKNPRGNIMPVSVALETVIKSGLIPPKSAKIAREYIASDDSIVCPCKEVPHDK